MVVVVVVIATVVIIKRNTYLLCWHVYTRLGAQEAGCCQCECWESSMLLDAGAEGSGHQWWQLQRFLSLLGHAG